MISTFDFVREDRKYAYIITLIIISVNLQLSHSHSDYLELLKLTGIYLYAYTDKSSGQCKRDWIATHLDCPMLKCWGAGVSSLYLTISSSV